VKIQPSSVSPSDFAAETKIARTPISVNKAYGDLRVNSQRDAIDRILEDAKRQELNPFAEWKLAFIQANRKPVAGTFRNAIETKDIRLIIKRMPRQQGAPPSPKFGRVIDTTEPQLQPNWQQQQQLQLQQQLQQQQQQQQQQHQQMMMSQQLPPPPQNMPPPPSQLPPPPNPPPGPKPGPGGPGIQVMGGGGQGKKNDNKDGQGKENKDGSGKYNKDQKSKGGNRSRSPSPGPIRKETKTVKEKVMEWDAPDPRKKHYSDSDDDSPKPIYEKTIKHKISSSQLAGQLDRKFSIPAPPMGQHYMSGANDRPLRSPPLRKSSMREPSRRPSPPRGKYRVERRTVERLVPSDLTEDEPYELVDRRSSLWSDHSSEYTDASSLESRGSYRSHKSGEHPRRRHSSRSRHRDDRRDSFHSDDRRERYPRERRDRLREHRKPESYRGFSPSPPPSEHDRPVIVHIHNNDATLAKQYPTEPVTALPYREPPSPIRVPEQRRIAYAEEPTYPAWLDPVPHAPMVPASHMVPTTSMIPAAPMVPTYESQSYERLRQQEAAAKIYLDTQRRRAEFSRADDLALARAREGREAQRRRDDLARARARDELEREHDQRERYETQRRLDELKREAERKKRVIDDLARDAQRTRDDMRRRQDAAGYGSYNDRRRSTSYGNDNRRTSHTEFRREAWMG
jgi:type II secretory pathway pseudopilin PulG